MNNNLKFIVTGHSRHGKDTVCNLLLKHFNLPSISSSLIAAPLIFQTLKDKYGYYSIQEAYEDRHNHKKEWFDLIVGLNTPDLTFLGTKIFNEYPVYNGIRNIDELNALKEKFPDLFVIWVDASRRVDKESCDSCTVSSAGAKLIIYNNGSEDELELVVVNTFSHILGGSF